MFSTYSYEHDPYQDRPTTSYVTDKALRGKRGFLTTPAKKGRGPDATIPARPNARYQ